MSHTTSVHMHVFLNLEDPSVKCLSQKMGGESLVTFGRKALDFQHLDLAEPIRLQSERVIIS